MSNEALTPHLTPAPGIRFTAHSPERRARPVILAGGCCTCCCCCSCCLHVLVGLIVATVAVTTATATVASSAAVQGPCSTERRSTDASAAQYTQSVYWSSVGLCTLILVTVTLILWGIWWAIGVLFVAFPVVQLLGSLIAWFRIQNDDLPDPYPALAVLGRITKRAFFGAAIALTLMGIPLLLLL